jgi:hypothetical protein
VQASGKIPLVSVKSVRKTYVVGHLAPCWIKNSIWRLMDPNLNIFAFAILFDIIPSQPSSGQNYSMKCLSGHVHGLWDTL